MSWIAAKIRASKLAAVHTHAKHGSRFKHPPVTPFVGIMKKRKNGAKHALGGIFSGRSVDSNWTEYRFELNFKTAELSYFNLEAGAGSPRGSERGGAAGVLCLNYHSQIIEMEHSSSKGHPKLAITGRDGTGKDVEWELKLSAESEIKEWRIQLKKARQPRWEENTKKCQICESTFGLKRSVHHCRRCGKCVCHSCSDNWSDIFEARICDPCHVEAKRNRLTNNSAI
jgi:hypothetical protein